MRVQLEAGLGGSVPAGLDAPNPLNKLGVDAVVDAAGAAPAVPVVAVPNSPLPVVPVVAVVLVAPAVADPNNPPLGAGFAPPPNKPAPAG